MCTSTATTERRLSSPAGYLLPSFPTTSNSSSTGYYTRRERVGRFRSFHVCLYIYIYTYACTYTIRMYAYRDWIVFARGRIYACMCVSRARESVDEREREREGERDRDRNREQERVQIGHGWSVRSSFQTTPFPFPLLLPATFHLSSFLCFAPRPLFHIYVFLRPIARPIAPSFSLALAYRSILL